MKKITFVLFAILSVVIGFAQGSENFNNATTLPTGSDYGNGNFVGNDGVTWNYTHCQSVGDYEIDGNGILLRRANEPSSVRATFQGGIGNFSADIRKGYAGNAQRRVELVINNNVIEQLQPAFSNGEDDTVLSFSVEDINIEGEITLEIRLFGANGNQHLVVDNIVWTEYPATSTDPCDDLGIVSVEGASVCDSGSVTLEATATTENIYWYANQTGGDVIGSGTSFTTPNLTETTSYWVSEYMLGEDSVQSTGQGKVAPFPTSDGTSPSVSGWGLIFNATESFVLEDVQVFITSASTNLVVSLTDMSFNVLQTTTVVAPAGTSSSPTPFTVPLEFNISPGQYRLVTATGPSMIRDFSPAFPYSIGTVGQIINGALGTGTNAAYYYFYNWSIRIGEIECESERVEVIATINETIDIMISASEEEICEGSSSVLSVTSDNEDYEYTWEPGTLTGASVSVSPTETTTYTVTAIDPNTGCTTEDTITIVVKSVPDTLIITSSVDGDVCEGTIVALTAGSSGAEGIVYDFEGTISDWTIIDSSSGPTIGWGLVTSPTSGVSSNDASQFFFSNPDSGSSGTTVNSQLISPSFSLAGSTNASFNFFHFYRNYQTTGAVQVSVDGGATYTTLVSYTATTGTATNFQEVNLSLNSFLGESDVRIRFNYTGGWGYHWAIDNVTILGAVSGTTTWEPVTGLYLDEEATIPYDGSEVATVYMYSETAGNFDYTATLTVGTCGSISEEITITVIDAPELPQGDSEQTFDTGDTIAALEVTGSNLTWYSDENGTTVIPSSTSLVDGVTYYVSQTVGECESELLAITVEEVLSTSNNPFAGFKYYPNPVENTLILKATNIIESAVIYNTLGQIISENKINASETEIDFSNLPTGSYFIKVASEGKTSTYQLIKK